MAHKFLLDGWSPKQLPELRLWLSAKKAATSLSASLGASTTVTTLPDFSGNAFSFTQATADAKPVIAYDGTTYYITSDGTDDLMVRSATDISSAQAGYVCIALERITAFDTNTRIFLSSGDEASGVRYGLFGVLTTGRIYCGMRNNDTEDSVRVADAGTAVVVDTPYILEFFSNGSSISISINGNAQALTVVTGSNTGRWFGDVSARDSFTIFALKRNTESNFAPINLCDMVICNAVPTAAQRTTLRNYLNTVNDLRIALA